VSDAAARRRPIPQFHAVAQGDEHDADRLAAAAKQGKRLPGFLVNAVARGRPNVGGPHVVITVQPAKVRRNPCQ